MKSQAAEEERKRKEEREKKEKEAAKQHPQEIAERDFFEKISFSSQSLRANPRVFGRSESISTVWSFNWHNFLPVSPIQAVQALRRYKRNQEKIELKDKIKPFPTAGFETLKINGD